MDRIFGWVLAMITLLAIGFLLSGIMAWTFEFMVTRILRVIGRGKHS